ncbi:hypothetical protein [Christiangramia sabulilitoris]|nr:hypothetical protein [Christiangramia sabulilitoris]
MEKQGKRIISNVVLADMHCNGVYFDKDILSAHKQESILIASNQHDKIN